MSPYTSTLEAALRTGSQLARDLRHANVGTEHVLLSLLDEPRAAGMLQALKVDRDTLRQRLIACLDEEPLTEDGAKLQPTGTLQRALARAALYVEASGAEEMTSAHVLVAILSERCRAGQLLQEQGMTRAAAIEHVTRSTSEAPPKPDQKPERVVVSAKGYVDLPWPEAVEELRLESRLGGRCLWHYYETAEEEIARIENDPMMRPLHDDTSDWRDKARRRVRRMPYVRYWHGDAVIDGDLDLDATFDPYLIAGFAIDGNATVSGSIQNWEIDTHTSFLSVAGDLACHHCIIGCSDTVVLGNVRASGVIVATYNHGWLEINGDVHAHTLILDDHDALIRGDIHAAGWTSSDRDLALPVSDWRAQVRPEFNDEFFLENGDFRNPNGNVSLVKALIAGRDILKPRSSRR